MNLKIEHLRKSLRRTWIGPGLVVLLVCEAIQKLVDALHFPLTDIAGLCGNWVIRHARWQVPFYSGSLSWKVSFVPLLDTLIATGIVLTVALLFGRWLYRDRI
jgi:hypothetical protein